MVRQHVVEERVAAEQRPGAVGVRADGRDPAPGRERQYAVVAQQHHRLLGQATSEGAMLRRVEVDRGRRVVVEGRVEQPQLELLPQDPQHRPVDERLVDAPGADRLGQRRRVRVAGGQFDVDTGGQRLDGGVAEVARDVVQQVQERHAEVVRDDRPVEAPLIAQHAGEQARIGRDRYAVDLGVRVHHRAGVAVQDRHLERDQQHVGDLAGAGVDRGEVAPGTRGGVADEVLERGVHPLRLQAPHIRRTDGADQVRVLADALLDPPPPRVADDVEYGCEALVDAERPHRLPDRGAHPLDQLRVEGGAPRERGGKRGRLPGRQPGQALLVHDRRDAEPRFGDQPALERPQPAGPLGGVDRPSAVRAGEVPEPVAGELFEAGDGAELALQRRDRLTVLLLPEAHDLRELLFQRHLGEEREDAHLWFGPVDAARVGTSVMLCFSSTSWWYSAPRWSDLPAALPLHRALQAADDLPFDEAEEEQRGQHGQ